MRGTKAKRLRRMARALTTDFESHAPKFWSKASNAVALSASIFTIPLTFAYPNGSFRRIYRNLKAKEQ